MEIGTSNSAIGSGGGGTAPPPFAPWEIANFLAGYDGSQLLFQDAAGTTPVSADGQEVHSWKSVGGISFPLTVADMSDSPVWRSNGPNGRGYVRFGGEAPPEAPLSNAADLTSSAAITVVAVVRVTWEEEDEPALYVFRMGTDELVNYLAEDNGSGFRWTLTSVNGGETLRVGPLVSNGDWVILSWRTSATPLTTLRIDALNQSITNSTVGLTQPDELVRAGFISSAGGTPSVDIAYLLAYARSLTIEEIGQIESGLSVLLNIPIGTDA